MNAIGATRSLLRQRVGHGAALGAVFAIVGVGCSVKPQEPIDPGKDLYDQAVLVEEQAASPGAAMAGADFLRAAEGYDAVCRRAPDSKFCAPSKGRALYVRLEAAKRLIEKKDFKGTKDVLAVVASKDGTEEAKQAKALLESKELVAGLRFGAVRDDDPIKALAEMEELAKGDSAIAKDAAERLRRDAEKWIAAALRSECGFDLYGISRKAPPKAACPEFCERVLGANRALPDHDHVEMCNSSLDALIEGAIKECAAAFKKPDGDRQSIRVHFERLVSIRKQFEEKAPSGFGEMALDVYRNEWKDAWDSGTAPEENLKRGLIRKPKK